MQPNTSFTYKTANEKMGVGDLVFQYKYSNKVLFYLNISHFDFFEIFLVGKWLKQKYKMCSFL